MIKLKCPVCGGSISNISITEYEDGNIIRIVTKGKCSRCGTPFTYEKVIKLKRHEYITW